MDVLFVFVDVCFGCLVVVFVLWFGCSFGLYYG